MPFALLDCSLNSNIPEAEILAALRLLSKTFTISIVATSLKGYSFSNFQCLNMSLYSWPTYFAVLFLWLRILYPQQEEVSEDSPLLKTADFYFSLDTRPNENPALKINFTPVNPADELITPLELNHIEFSTLSYYCKEYPNEWGNFVSGWKETRFFSFRPGKNGFRINTARVVPTNDSYIISRRTIVFRNIDSSTIKAIRDAYDSYASKMIHEKWRERNTL